MNFWTRHWLYTYFDKNKLLSEQQYGFREIHFTKLAAVKLVDYINHEMDIGNTPEAIFIDLSKAFVMLNFDILIHKLQFYVRYSCLETPLP